MSYVRCGRGLCCRCGSVGCGVWFQSWVPSCRWFFIWCMQHSFCCKHENTCKCLSLVSRIILHLERNVSEWFGRNSWAIPARQIVDYRFHYTKCLLSNSSRSTQGALIIKNVAAPRRNQSMEWNLVGRFDTVRHAALQSHTSFWVQVSYWWWVYDRYWKCIEMRLTSDL